MACTSMLTNIPHREYSENKQVKNEVYMRSYFWQKAAGNVEKEDSAIASELYMVVYLPYPKKDKTSMATEASSIEFFEQVARFNENSEGRYCFSCKEKMNLGPRQWPKNGAILAIQLPSFMKPIAKEGYFLFPAGQRLTADMMTTLYIPYPGELLQINKPVLVPTQEKAVSPLNLTSSS